MFGQLSNRESLRDLVVALEAHKSKCYHLGLGRKTITKTTFASANQDSVDLIRIGKMLPSSDGDILVYKKFWTGVTESNMVPKILTYADLMGTTDSRCLEAAKRIIDDEK